MKNINKIIKAQENYTDGHVERIAYPICGSSIISPTRGEFL